MKKLEQRKMDEALGLVDPADYDDEDEPVNRLEAHEMQVALSAMAFTWTG